MKLILLQLPVPKLNYGLKTGNAPLGAACIKQAMKTEPDIIVEIIPEKTISYLGDQALIDLVSCLNPDFIGFTTFCWNIERSLFLAVEIKKRTGATTILGGPEITSDNLSSIQGSIDCFIIGEGESVFQSLFSQHRKPKGCYVSGGSDSIFEKSMSPYVDSIINADVDHTMLLETQRGCPYNCGFCYYSKARQKLCFADKKRLIQGMKWAVQNNIEELYLLDPSLNARPDLDDILLEMAVINKNSALSIISEIRAESITENRADLFRKAGFTGFEIGLQTINPVALKIMKRNSNLDKFLKGVGYLKKNLIQPRIDLIFGLPGDTLSEFVKSLKFISEHDLHDDIQIFPLSVLPGTDFRINYKKLGLEFQKEPPYTVTKTNGFSEEEMVLALDYAESLFDISLYPLPDMDLSYRNETDGLKDICVTLDRKRYISKIIFDELRTHEDIESLSQKLTSPYQLYFNTQVSESYICRVVRITTLLNPYVPFEIIFRNPVNTPDFNLILESMHIKRPHFLDNDQRYLYPDEGNRSVLFTILTDLQNSRCKHDMVRQVFIWNEKDLPDFSNMEDLADFHGILIESGTGINTIKKWQNEYCKYSEDIPLITFPDTLLQKRWFRLTAPDDYYMDSFN